ncbi:MAG: TM2 domain-containing protein [Bacilli bacterium]
MPYCRNCHHKIERMNKEFCPYCGTPRPLQGVSLETMDITKAIPTLASDEKLPRVRSRKVAAFLAATLGLFGVHEFYMKKPKLGIVFIVITTLLIGGVGSLLFLFILKLSIWGYLIPVFIQILFQCLFAFFLYKKEDLKDGNGELMR